MINAPFGMSVVMVAAGIGIPIMAALNTLSLAWSWHRAHGCGRILGVQATDAATNGSHKIFGRRPMADQLQFPHANADHPHRIQHHEKNEPSYFCRF